jgi:hypothetical protein
LETLIRAKREERLKFIAQHKLNIDPSTDDKPFFFQFYRWGNLLSLFEKDKSNVQAPLALLILLSSFAQVTILSGIFILYPLYRRKTMPMERGGCAGIFIYFASLGLGFIIAEIVLLQKLTVFLGGPAYSMSVTLFTLLLTSGAGSFVSRNWSARPFQLLASVIPLLFITIISESLVLDMVIPSLMHLSNFMRGVTVAVFIAPLGLLMGMPFPAGLRYVDRYRPELNPWAWGINACATVMGAVVCVLISSTFGFRNALLLSAFIYLIGWLILMYSQRRVTMKTVP